MASKSRLRAAGGSHDTSVRCSSDACSCIRAKGIDFFTGQEKIKHGGKKGISRRQGAAAMAE